MEECSICLSKIKKIRKNLSNQRNKNKFQIWLKKDIVRNPEIDEFKDIIQSYYDKHKRKFYNFSVCALWRKNDVFKRKSSVPSTITLEKPHLL